MKLTSTLSLPTLLMPLGFLLALTGCPDDTTNPGSEEMGEQDMNDTVRCTVNERLNPDTNMCEPFFEMPDLGDMGSSDDGGDAQDMPADMPIVEDMLPDVGPDPNCVDTLVFIDNDGDLSGVDDPATNQTVCITFDAPAPAGYARVAGDCDDQNPSRNPGLSEICDDLDNDCDEVLNQGITCEFFVHSREELYRIDPFKLTISFDGIIDTPRPLLDIDTHPNGQLYGISSETLYAYIYNSATDVWEWRQVGDLQESLQGANGLAIDRNGQAYATARNELFEIDLQTGRASSPSTLSGQVNSSGDCVVNKGNSLFMTSKPDEQGSDRNDELLSVQRNTNTTTVVGLTNHRRIYGLTAAWGRLFGVTSDAELIEIDQGTGESRLLKQFNNVDTFFGAASTPNR